MREPDSFKKEVAWIFEGIGEDEKIGDFGLIGGGAAGLELDRADPLLGTPPNTYVLASSKEHTDLYLVVCEELDVNRPNCDGTQDPLVRADIVFYETANGGRRVLHQLDRMVREPCPQRPRQQRLAHDRERPAPLRRSDPVLTVTRVRPGACDLSGTRHSSRHAGRVPGISFNRHHRSSDEHVDDRNESGYDVVGRPCHAAGVMTGDAPMSRPVLEVDALTKRFGTVTAVDAVSFGGRAGDDRRSCSAPTERARPPPWR